MFRSSATVLLTTSRTVMAVSLRPSLHKPMREADVSAYIPSAHSLQRPRLGPDQQFDDSVQHALPPVLPPRCMGFRGCRTWSGMQRRGPGARGSRSCCHVNRRGRRWWRFGNRYGQRCPGLSHSCRWDSALRTYLGKTALILNDQLSTGLYQCRNLSPAR